MSGRFFFGKILLAVALGILIAAGGLKAVAVDSDGMALSASLVWTGQPDADEKNGSCVAFRKHFQLVDAAKKVTLQIFADTRYMLWVNGQQVQRGPARFEPQSPEYDSVDVSPFLHKGDNLIVVLVTSRISNGKTRMHAPGISAQLMQFGQSICTTDATWKWSNQTRYRGVKTDWPNIYDMVDARVEDGDWTLPNYDDSKWAAVQPTQNTWGALTGRRIPWLRETVVEPVWTNELRWPVTLTTNEAVSFKFQHLVLAYVQIEMDADEGSELELTYSPKTKILCRAGKQTYISTDTHSIFEGGIRVKSGRVTLQSVKFVERLYPFDRIGSFKSSDPLLDKLWTTCVRGLEITSEDAYVDCTDRERVEWMDCDPPAFDVTRVAMAGSAPDGKEIYSDPRLLEEMLRRTAYTLQPDGWVKAHTSSDRFDIHAKMEDRACDWVEGARRYYESCGKTEVIREIWPAMVAQMNYFLDRRTPRGLVCAREWVVWGNPVGYQTCEGTALNAFICRALADAAFLGNLIGEKKQAKQFDHAAKDLAKAINTVLWDEVAGTYYAGYYDLAVAKKAADYRPLKLKVEDNLIEPTRHAALFALDQVVVPENRRASVTQFLMNHAPTQNDIMQYYYFFKQQYAADDSAQDLAVLNKQRAEWKDMAESRYEAAFEGLHSWGSQAHCYGMFPAYFLSSYVLGVRLDGPVQKKSLLIEPRLGDLTEASGTVVTEFGPMFVSWKLEGNQWNYVIDTSKLMTAPTIHLHLPVGTGKFSAGLDEAFLKTGAHGVKQQGRWLNVPLTLGKHQGSWKLIPTD
ncbi:MAG TPA: alpha-L-rhamnosidase N-terminal domain-containing protein [Candidatus Limnocylindrales bacterium]|nr:alpha-L-rhamnosidase N-terminal domain-containing protein [Candidatus Limnocylindrales bacterium]